MNHQLRLVAAALLLVGLAASGCGSGGGTVSPTAGGIQGYVFGRTARSAAAMSSGRLTPPSGTEPLPGATVTVTAAGAQTAARVLTTDTSGLFRATGLNAGEYNATVSRAGYHDATFTVTVVAQSTRLAGVDNVNGVTILQPVNAARKKWTFMVYMGADGDLEEFGILNLNQMESVGSDENVNIVVQADRGPGYDATNGDWTDTRRFYVTRDQDMSTVTSPVLENLGEVDMGQPETLRDFITWATTNYPADNYVMVPWNHGAGWRSRPLPAASRGIIFDDTSNTFLTMGEFNAGLNVPGVHFDLVAIDCSLMGMIEVAWEIRERADYIAFSEESPPGPGYPYHRILGALAADPNMTAEQLGRIIVDEHIVAYAREAVTQSLVRTSRLADFGAKVDALAAALLQVYPARKAEFDAARTGSQAYSFSYYRDVYDFARSVKASLPDVPAVVSAADAVMNGLSAADGGPVVAEAHNLSQVAGSHGLSIYLPGSTQFFSGYGDLRFSQDFGNWYSLVRRVTGMDSGG
ncbi:MAG: carboxypeptidase regulatory-like domain-containing protein [Armatimonadetes bacterium]|nr:carboxypeptidase regulatory-like domain-containing protein [Armatimonadota bacterium]